MAESRYFITVDWCKEGRRGVFCNNTGVAYSKDTQHTTEEMDKILGPFWLILDPESTPFTEEELMEYKVWTPLDEYSGVFGVARREDG